MKLSSFAPFILHSGLCILQFGSVAIAAEPIYWSGGGWDEADAPKGALLTDNPGWWGRSVFTGVTYSYEEGVKPTNPGDNTGRRLIDAKMFGEAWITTVGKGGDGRISAVFDFKRPCVFSEVDLFTRAPGLHGKVEVGDDGTNWTAICSFELAAKMGRFGVDGAKGRFMRLSVKADKGVTYLDEVLVWGEGEVSDTYPEAYAPINPGDALKMSEPREGGGIEIRPIAKPTLAAAKEKFKVQGSKFKVDEAASNGAGAVPAVTDKKVGPHSEILLARNETEVRYFAVANASTNAVTVALSAPDFGDNAIAAELLVGGVVRMEKPAPKEKLTQKQIIDLLITDESKLYEQRPQRLEVLPFFRAGALPAPNFARRYLANAAQILGFPAAVPLGPGEGCVVMLRVTTDSAAPGRRRTQLKVQSSKLKVESSKAANTQPSTFNLQLLTTVVDATLPDLPLWIHAYSPFTSQFPFESESRMKTDARRLAALGVSSCYGLPRPRTKQAFLKTLAPHTICANPWWLPSDIFHGTARGKWEHFDSTNRAAIAESAHKIVREAESLGLKPDEYCVFLPDEPGRHNAALAGELARIAKEAEPTLMIYENPCFWERGFPPHVAIRDCLAPYYNEVIDISCPLRNLVRPGNLLTKELWTAKRRVNAQYIHPPGRAGRSIAWSSFVNGLNGFAYYCYYSPRGNPWDIRTWTSLDYSYQMVFPLDNDVSVTPIYETMREAWEDYRMLEVLRRAGKDKLLDELLKSYEGATDYADRESVPNHSDFQSLHDKALGAFVKFRTETIPSTPESNAVRFYTNDIGFVEINYDEEKTGVLDIFEH